MPVNVRRKESGGNKGLRLGEDLAWFVHLEEDKKEYLERRKEKTSRM
jgi:hypothetical protein